MAPTCILLLLPLLTITKEKARCIRYMPISEKRDKSLTFSIRNIITLAPNDQDHITMGRNLPFGILWEWHIIENMAWFNYSIKLWLRIKGKCIPLLILVKDSWKRLDEVAWHHSWIITFYKVVWFCLFGLVLCITYLKLIDSETPPPDHLWLTDYDVINF